MKYKTMSLVVLLLLTVGFLPSRAQQDGRMYKLHALFIYNFTKHIKWDASDNSSFTVGVYANQAALAAIKANLENKSVWGKKINVIAIKSAREAGNCHIAYVPSLNNDKDARFISQCKMSNTLLVSGDDMIDKGAAISFVTVDSKLKFKIDKMKVEQAGLKVSNSLLAVGISV